MQAMILAAGFGSRLAPLTERLPKALVAAAGQRLIDWALGLVVTAGCERVVINTHHLGAELERLLTERLPADLEVVWSHEGELLGTGGGLRRARPHLTETTLVINADIMIEVDVVAMIDAHRARGAQATMALHRANDGEDLGVVRVGSDGLVKDIVGGVTRIELGDDLAPGQSPPAHLVAAKGAPHFFRGVHLIEPSFIDTLPDETFSCVVRQGYIPQIAAGAPVLGFVSEGRWADAGTPQRLIDAHHRFWSSAAPVVEEGALIDPSARLHGRTHVARGARVGAGVTLTDVLVQPGASVASGAALEGCVVYGDDGARWG